MCRRKGLKRRPNYCGTMADHAKTVRRCFLVLAGWLADHEEHPALHNLDLNCCPKCEVDPQSLGELRKSLPPDHTVYQQKITNYKDTQDLLLITDLAAVGLKALTNGLRTLPWIQPSKMQLPDLLPTVYLGLLKNLLDWITSFLKHHCRLDPIEHIWLSMPPYPGFTPPAKAFREVFPWQGKEMRMFGRMVLPAMAIVLGEPNTSQWYLFNCALECMRNLVDIHLVAQYRSHTTEILAYLDNYSKCFHENMKVFL